jgi:signal transduction histidine kinase
MGSSGYLTFLQTRSEMDDTGDVEATNQLNQYALAAAVIHEVRRLLTPARAYAELALRQPGLTPDAAKSLAAIIDASRQCNDAMECLVAGRDSGGSSCPGEYIAALKAPDLVTRASTMSRVPLSNAALEVVLSNLISNARRASGGSVIQLHVEQSATGNTRIAVRDSGVGMAADQALCATTPFVSNSSSSGLGLAICRHLVETAGGKLTIVSKPGVGTEVSVELSAIQLRKTA